MSATVTDADSLNKFKNGYDAFVTPQASLAVAYIYYFYYNYYI